MHNEFGTDPQSNVTSLNRRRVLQTAAALAASTIVAPKAFARDYGRNIQPQRYPDPDIVVIDAKRFTAKVGNTVIKRL